MENSIQKLDRKKGEGEDEGKEEEEEEEEESTRWEGSLEAMNQYAM